MTGRRRRVSTSSVETVHDRDIRWLKEYSVVKRRPADEHPDNWPLFELKDATVFNKDGYTMENALDVGMKGPFFVRGHLLVEDKKQRQHLIMKVGPSTPIEIGRCENYSIGESVDTGSPVIWVSGRGAWYEIIPSPAYRDIYNKMCEAATFYYILFDFYTSDNPRKRKKSKGSPTKDELSQISLQYATHVGDGSTFDEVAQRCNTHASFLTWQFITQRDSDKVDWSTTGFYKWHSTEYKDLYEKAREFIKNPPSMTRPSPEARNPDPTASAVPLRSSRYGSAGGSRISEVPDTTSSTRTNKPTRPKAAANAPSATPKKVSRTPDLDPDTSMPLAEHANRGVSAFASVLDALESAYEEMVTSKHGLTVSGTLNKLYFKYSVPNYRDGPSGCHQLPVRELLHYNAKALLQTIQKSKYGKHEIYGFLRECARTELHLVAYKPTDFPVVLQPRKKKEPRQPRASDLVPSGASAHDLRDATSSHKDITGGKQPNRRAKKSSLRLPTSSNKRPHSDLESDDESEGSAAKRSHYFSDGKESMEDASNVDSPNTTDALDIDGAGGDAEPVRIVIRADRIPSTHPFGPHETWTCDQDGCDYIVRGGDQEECQNRIRAHFCEHEEQMQRVNLAVTESRGLLPINHLLEKIKALGERSQAEPIQLNGVLVPQPIKRKLIV